MDLQPYQKRTWAEINLDAVEQNFLTVRKRLNGKTKLCCVVKANGYGHGAVQLSKQYEKLGADYLAVSNIEEAIQLRNNGIRLPILILGYTDPRCVIELSKYSITQCVFSYDYGVMLSRNAMEHNVVVKIHIKLDTGMGRIGFLCAEEELNLAAQVCRMQGLTYEGIFTHFAMADEGERGVEYTYGQFNKFMAAIEYLRKKGITFSIRHCANSAAIFDYQEMHLDMVRAGIVLYGLQPSVALRSPGELCPVMKLITIIDHVKTVHSGECISYGGEYKAGQDVRVATIPIGYADGLWRSNFKNHMMVETEGKLAPIIGRVCMDQCMIDVSDIPEAKVYSKVTVYGANGDISIDQIARANETINYEIVCAVGERVQRVYKENNQIVAVIDSIV